MKQYKFKISGKEYCVDILSIDDKYAQVRVGGRVYDVETEEFCSKTAPVTPVAASEAVAAAPVTVQQGRPSVSGGKVVVSPLPGVILSVKVNVGDHINAGQTVAVLEAMKMENEIESDCSGIVSSINVTQGASVLEGDKIITLA